MTSTTERLDALLERNKQQILRAWRARVMAELVPHAIPRAELIDSVPVFLDEVIATLAREAGGETPAETAGLRSNGRVHGGQRLHLGFDVAG
ncbi:MAG TPA: RsbRD N-terminal domain-containing protein, partial [Polyangiaceae bacterium]|nr:RsbRD N-terminal domain-containing protein [Polyangiaceae bacterium]